MKDTTRMCKWSILLGMLLLVMAIVIGTKTTAIADVNVGDVIDSSNYQKIKGMVPTAISEYVQKGWITMKIGKLNYEPGEVMPAESKEYLPKNVGRYAVTAKGELLDKTTGKIDPYDIIGLPFPNIDVKHPDAALQMLYNKSIAIHWRGDMKMTATLYFVGKKMERYIAGPQLTMSFLGTSRNIAKQANLNAQQRAEKMQSFFIMKVTDPYELNGLATMSYFNLSNAPDKVFAYVPALRRTRVMTSAARSDSMFGTDYAMDDAAGGMMGKTRDFTCKYLRTQDSLMRFANPNIIELVKKKEDLYEISKTYTNVKWGFQTPGWKGKAWATTNDFWVKRKAHVIECQAKDPYYNYGKFELWVDSNSYVNLFKVIMDRAGKRWKVMNTGTACYASKDGIVAKCDPAFGDWIYDEQRDHATAIDEFNTKETKLFTKNSPDDFSMAGLAKFSK